MKTNIILSTLFMTAGISFSGAAFVPMVEEGKTWWYEIGSVVTEEKPVGEKYEIGLTLGEKITLEDQEWNKLFIIDRDGTQYERPVGYLREADGRVYFRDEMTYQFLSDYRDDFSEDVFAFIKYYLYPPFSGGDPTDFVTPGRCRNTLIYDFNKAIGDKDETEYYDSLYILAEIIDSEIFKGCIIQKWHPVHIEPTSVKYANTPFICDKCTPEAYLYCIEGIGCVGMQAGAVTSPNFPFGRPYKANLPLRPTLKSVTDAYNRVLYTSYGGAIPWISEVSSTLEVSPEYRKRGNILILDNIPEGAKIEIISTSGLRYPLHSESTSLEIRTGDFAAGVYLVNIRYRNELITTFRIIL